MPLHACPCQMECKVPIEFEFKIRKLRSNPCFRVEPMQGLVPASGHISVDIAFSPTMLRTEEMQLEVGALGHNKSDRGRSIRNVPAEQEPQQAARPKPGLHV